MGERRWIGPRWHGARSGTRTRIAASLLTVAVSLSAASAVQARGVIPKGTPYAALVSATVSGDVFVSPTTQTVTDGVCETQSAVSTYQGTFKIHWAATYPSIFVPVADSEDLGKAYRELHLNLGPLDGFGKGGVFTGSYDASGSQPATSAGNQGVGGSDCQPVPFSGSGSFVPCLTRPSVLRAPVSLPQKQFVYLLQMQGVCFGEPESYGLPPGGTEDAVEDLQTATDSVGKTPGSPPPGPFGVVNGELVPGWNGVPFAFSDDQFKPLVHRSSMTLRAQDSSSGADGEDCGSTPDNGSGSFTCTVAWRYFYEVTFKRKLLYRTTRVYRR